jgi:hypothetical protein
MANMSHSTDHDPKTKSRYEPDRFNVAWLKNGEKLSSFQRIGFGVLSLFIFVVGVVFGASAFNAIREGHVLGACGWSIPTLIFVIPGGLGLRNVLRFE